MKNGHDPNFNDPKIASFEAARKKAAAAKKSAAREASAGLGSGRNPGQMIFGGLIVAMAVGMLVWWGRSLFQSMSLAP